MARMNFGPILNFMVLIGVILLFVYAMKNPNFKTMLNGIFQKITGKVGGTTPAPQQQAAPQQPAPTPKFQRATETYTEQQSTAPGTRSQDPITQAINRCVGVGVNPPDPQAYNDCVNAAVPKANRARIGIA